MRQSARTADATTIRLLDGISLLWFAIWLLIGSWTCLTMWQIADVGDTLAVSGNALHSSGEALSSLGPIPVVGDNAAAVGVDVKAAATEVTARGAEVKRELRQLAVLLGLAIIVVPMAPVGGLYLPLRWARSREIRAIRASLDRHRDDPVLDRYLGARALANLGFSEIRAVSVDPWEDLAVDPRALADAELRRLGIVRPGG
jgi:hypothetical protein